MAIGTNLPMWPALVFTYFEPLSLIIGFYAAFFNPASFVSRQLPLAIESNSDEVVSAIISTNAIIVAQSIANMFLVQCLLSFLFTVLAREARLTKYYLAIAAIGDFGHIYASYSSMGSEMFWDFSGYNDMMVGNVFVSAFLWCTRVGTLLGFFGKVGRNA